MKFEKATTAGFYARIVIVGGTGDGKSTSALRLATGLADGGLICVIDTDNGRARLNADEFDFQVCELGAPYNGDRYVEAIDAAMAMNPSVIIVDDVSREHHQMLDDHADATDALVKRFNSTPEKVSMGAWRDAKAPRKRLEAHLHGLKCHVITTMRSERKIDARTKKYDLEVEGHVGFARAAHACLVLTPNKDGLPDYAPEGNLGQIAKLHRTMRKVFRPGERITEQQGVELAEMANGTSKTVEERIGECDTPSGLTALWKSLPSAQKTDSVTELFKSRKAAISAKEETEVQQPERSDDGSGEGDGA